MSEGLLYFTLENQERNKLSLWSVISKAQIKLKKTNY